ncbi:MAG: YicC/YloC family endoribonuclease [Candidatus Neomarinimicrobiota bacterium]|mgnify:FL=1
MTGFGRGFSGQGKNRIDIEIRAVNSRYLEIKLRGFPIQAQVEQELRKIIEKDVQRGSIYVRIELNNNHDLPSISFNRERYESLQGILKNIYVSYGQRLNLSDVITTNDLLKIEDSKSIDQALVLEAANNAIEQLNEMREREGEIIYADIKNRIEFLEKTLVQSEKIAENLKIEKQLDLKNKISELLNDKKLDESRLIQEVAYYSERSDVTEELVRCRSHIKQVDNFINMNEPVGKRLNFLLQEINREVNTIGSKSPQTDVTMLVVEMKSELEKLREQLQNLI